MEKGGFNYTVLKETVSREVIFDPRFLPQVTFKDEESARRACADPTPIIDGRRANCNLASLGQKPRQGRGPRLDAGRWHRSLTPYKRLN